MTERSVKIYFMSPRTPEDNEKIRQERKQSIIQAAFKLFALRGYHRTAISEIAKEAGISKGLLYNYFENKEDLLKTVVVYNYQEASDMLYELFSKNKQDRAPQELAAYIIDAFFVMMKDYAPVWKLSIALSMQVSDMPEIQALMFRIFDESYKRIQLLLPSTEDAENQARIIAGTMDGIALQYYLTGDSYDLEGVKKTFINNLRKQIMNL